jgi:hypothetical protein
MFNITFSLALVYASTWLVVNLAPEAAGAGVSEIMAYLNGCFMPKASRRLGGSRAAGRRLRARLCAVCTFGRVGQCAVPLLLFWRGTSATPPWLAFFS